MLTNGLLSAGRSVLPRSRSARHLEHWLYHQPSVTELRFRRHCQLNFMKAKWSNVTTARRLGRPLN